MGQSSTKAGVVVWGSSEHGQLGLGVTEHMVTAWLGDLPATFQPSSMQHVCGTGSASARVMGFAPRQGQRNVHFAPDGWKNLRGMETRLLRHDAGVVESSPFGVELDVSAFTGVSDTLGLFEG